MVLPPDDPWGKRTGPGLRHERVGPLPPGPLPDRDDARGRVRIRGAARVSGRPAGADPGPTSSRQHDRAAGPHRTPDCTALLTAPQS